MKGLIDGLGLPEGSYVFADKGYASVRNRDILIQRNLKDGIIDKAARNRPLNSTQRIINRLISSVRYKVEQTIGTLKRTYHFKGEKNKRVSKKGKRENYIDIK